MKAKKEKAYLCLLYSKRPHRVISSEKGLILKEKKSHGAESHGRRKEQGENNVTGSDLKTTVTHRSWEPFPVLEENLISNF